MTKPVHPETGARDGKGAGFINPSWHRPPMVRSVSTTKDIRHTGPTDCVERPLSRFYYHYAKFVATYPLWFVLTPLLVTLACLPGLLLVEPNIDVIFLYTPRNGRSEYEQRVVEEKWPVGDHKYFPNRLSSETRQSQAIVIPKNDSDSVLDPPYDDETYILNLFITRQIAVFHKGKKYTYLDLCMRDYYGDCYVNRLMMILRRVRQLEGLRDIYGEEAFDVTYPWIEQADKKSYIASTLNDVQLYNGTNVVKKAKCWLLLYQLRYHPENISQLAGAWEREFEKAMLNYNSENINISFLHSQSLNVEADKNSTVAVPLIATCVVVMFFLVLFLGTVFKKVPTRMKNPFTHATYNRNILVVDWVESNHMISFFGVLTAGMASLVSVGLLVYIGRYFRGIQFGSVVYCMPFLTLSIGVDNMFLMVGAWRRANANARVEDKLAEAISEAGVSITITALTDSVSFAVGCITPFPSVYIFCMFTAVAIIVTFVFQLTFLLGLMAYYGRLQEAGRHNVVGIKVVPIKLAGEVGIFDKLLNLGTVLDDGEVHPEKQSFSKYFFEEWYTPILTHPIVRVIALSWMGLYLIAGIYGCLNIEQGLEPRKILLKESYAQAHYGNLLKYVLTYGTEVQVVVNNPPDFRQKGSIQEAWDIITPFLNTEHTLGRESVQFWLQEYERDLNRDKGFKYLLENGTVDYDYLLGTFLNKQQFVEWFYDLQVRNDSSTNNRPSIVSYRFIIAIKNYHTSEFQRATLNLLRATADRPELKGYNITTYYPLWHFGEQYNVVLPNTLQNMGIATLTMVIISLVLIPHPLSAFWVALSIISIDIGVIGFGAFWGLKIDIVTMITIIMSIGFSVDFSAHVCYHYIISRANTPEGRVKDALGIVGWPITQGAISTIAGILVICRTDSYLVEAFFKTVLLVITIGAVHGLIFIPVLLSLVVRGQCLGKRSE